MKKASVRIKDIALKAGVSTGTVDRVLHNRGRVAPDVEKRVLDILAEVNYQPNLIARALGSKKVYRIAALVPDPACDFYWRQPQQGIEKAEAGLKQYGVHVNQYIFNPYDVSSFIEQAKKITEAGPDGIFLSPIFYHDTLPFFIEWKNKDIPFVLFNTHIAESGALSYVGQDSYQSGLLAGKLIHYGQPQPCSILILHIDEEIKNAAHLAKKEEGIRDYYKENDPEQAYKIITAELSHPDQPGFAEHLYRIIDSEPYLRGIYVTTSKSYEIAACLAQRKINRIKLVGYDLLPENINHLNSGGISFLINQNPKGQGYWGIQQLVNHLVFKKEVSALKYLPLDIVTKENASYYISDELIHNDH
ncbi:substrate-binding domain-containing protein [Mucilaginibacter sp. BT774]|uniref:substrate-binding domain-containing protein n=1 Tax=Mucilaginibacter sp. BT774 TaxID=3062276 RepID=UPI002676CB32|nr:substrate-binding domain-containing protein [Mucilaginibacter sp. BT774]MDO3624760.1 substrate-binding domain-containing protein [Mucilaginibacter sp. BT774]